MKVIIAGSRVIQNKNLVEQAIINSGWRDEITEIVSGAARGVDQIGEYLAMIWDIPVKRFPANWDLYGKSAGYRRNAEMAAYSDALIAVWDGSSKGTKHMIDLATNKSLKVFIEKI